MSGFTFEISRGFILVLNIFIVQYSVMKQITVKLIVVICFVSLLYVRC